MQYNPFLTTDHLRTVFFLTMLRCWHMYLDDAHVTPLSVQFPHCLAIHLSASDSLRPWRYTNLLTEVATSLYSV